ncbi:hypothetical protein [Silvanigrella aquatica]|uniref:DNA polymerase III delta N-terminal domain-containing protein n=1 Tax=Silvanigrella aquatica TaxID=1915309 RepID=A0A1L4CZ65_9BACT|nr:hypothetical protein [Silvanigrella aquatica]APJ03225.1 hypothetical protein AXG55_04625 [Silvanigrella aquatica]
MQRIDASKLMQVLLATEKTPAIKFILADNPIYKKIIEDKIQNQSHKPAQIFSGKNAVVDYVEYAATGTLFFALQSSIVVLPDKLTAKQWEEEKKFLSRLIMPIESSAYFFAPTIYRNLIKETDLQNLASVYLCYEPNDIELYKCSEFLLSRYLTLAKKTNKEITEISHLAIECYSGDLVSCDMHFALMEKAGIGFADALVGTPEVNGFHVAEALARRDLYLIELRMSQCEACGEDAGSVFMALVYFLKQLSLVMSSFEETKNLKAAFEKTRIPFPAQARLQKAIQNITKDQLIRFFIAAPKVEMNLRTQKNAHKWLAAELIGWFLN